MRGWGEEWSTPEGNPIHPTSHPLRFPSFFPYLSFTISLPLILTHGHGFHHTPKPLSSHLPNAPHSNSQLPFFSKPPTPFHTIQFSIFRPQIIPFFLFLYPIFSCFFFTQIFHFCKGTFLQHLVNLSASFSLYTFRNMSVFVCVSCLKGQ